MVLGYLAHEQFHGAHVQTHRFPGGVVLVAALSAGCGGSAPSPSEASGPPLPWARSSLGAPPSPADNPTTDAKVGLGRLLFYDPILSSDRRVACSTCHSESFGMSDGLPESIGVGGTGPIGPGRTGTMHTDRNAQTLWNAAYREHLFWDGRADSLEDQIFSPLTGPVEMNGDPHTLVADLSAIPKYVELFKAAFPKGTQPVSYTNATFAIAAFERTLTSRQASYDRYVAGDASALDAESIQGMKLFAEAGCSSCHVPPRFESERYDNRGIDNGDGGRFDVTNDPADRGAFRVPTLRNVSATAPYFHDGSVAKLEDAVAHEAARSYEQGQSRQLSNDEVAAITTFLDKGLTDQTNAPSRPDQVPSGLQVPVAGSTP